MISVRSAKKPSSIRLIRPSIHPRVRVSTQCTYPSFQSSLTRREKQADEQERTMPQFICSVKGLTTNANHDATQAEHSGCWNKVPPPPPPPKKKATAKAASEVTQLRNTPAFQTGLQMVNKHNALCTSAARSMSPSVSENPNQKTTRHWNAH